MYHSQYQPRQTLKDLEINYAYGLTQVAPSLPSAGWPDGPGRPKEAWMLYELSGATSETSACTFHLSGNKNFFRMRLWGLLGKAGTVAFKSYYLYVT